VGDHSGDERQKTLVVSILPTELWTPPTPEAERLSRSRMEWPVMASWCSSGRLNEWYKAWYKPT